MSLIAPNKLSDITDEITKGLVPKINEKTINEVMNNPDIIESDKAQFMILLSEAKTKENSDEANKEFMVKLSELPKSVYDIVKPKMNMDRIKKIGLFLTIIYLISFAFAYVQSLIMATVSNKFAKSLRTKISNKINKLPLRYFDNHETGDILSRVTNDVDTMAQSMNQSLSGLVTNVTLFIGSIIMMVYTNWIMAITAILASILGFIFMGKILSKSQKYFTQRQTELGNLNSHIEEIYSGHNVVKVYNGEKKAKEEFDRLNDNLYDCNRKSQFLSGLMHPFMGFIGNFGYVAVCIVGAILTKNDVISFGVIVAFMIYIRLFTNPLTQIAQAMTSLQSTAAAAERVFEFLDEEEMADESEFKTYLKRERAKGAIEFKHVKFGYEDGNEIIKDFNVKVNPGEKVAIVGPTGAGKTTLVNLLMKFYDITEGEIVIDGIPTRNLTRENIHDLFVMVLQDTWLFDGTIGDNLRFNKENVSDEVIMDACEKVGIDHLIKTLPKGLDSKISDNDAISQGQKQLLTIARGMIEDGPFLILDEATSNVDTRTEELVQKAMDKLTVGKTSFIIAHRLSTIKNADLILVMDEGNIVEQGNHEELLKLNGLYASLYNSQFEK
jgi:ATP-binding cassette subfamily B protein